MPTFPNSQRRPGAPPNAYVGPSDLTHRRRTAVENGFGELGKRGESEEGVGWAVLDGKGLCGVLYSQLLDPRFLYCWFLGGVIVTSSWPHRKSHDNIGGAWPGPDAGGRRERRCRLRL